MFSLFASARFNYSLVLGLLYAASEIFLGFTRRSMSDTVSRDRRSLIVLWIVIGLSIFLSQFVLSTRIGILPHSPVRPIVGVAFFVLGIALRWYSIFYLGRFFTVDVAIAPGHEVIASGPYRFIRHPSYTGALLAFLGLALMLGNWLASLCLLLPVTAAFLWRIHVEERALSDALGEGYRGYVRRTKRLLPFIY
jgi:protein-S-isoprenylcysteine O-methyltransferase